MSFAAKSKTKTKLGNSSAPKGAVQKVVNFCNGSRIVRNIFNDREEWTFFNQALSDLTYQINFEGSTGVSIEGASDNVFTWETKSSEQTTFIVQKESNADFKFKIENTAEVPLSTQEQFDYITKNTPNLLTLVTTAK